MQKKTVNLKKRGRPEGKHTVIVPLSMNLNVRKALEGSIKSGKRSKFVNIAIAQHLKSIGVDVKDESLGDTK